MQRIRSQTPGLARRAAVVGFALLAVVHATDSWAKDVCVSDGSNTFIFKKVKTLRPGNAVPLVGIYQALGRATTFDGSAVMRADGSIAAGIFVHTLADDTGNFTMEWITDPSLAGVAKFDHNGDHESDGTLDLRVVDCSRIVLL